MKVVFLGTNDWANWANLNARAINRANIGVTARVVTRKIHPFQYNEDIVTERGPDDLGMASLVVSQADVLVTTGDGDYGGFDQMAAELGGRGKPVAACHVGTAYRQHPTDFDEEDRRRHWRRRFVSPDLYRFVKDDPEARIHFVPPDLVLAHLPPRASADLRVLHGPSNPAFKGTEEVERGFRSAEQTDSRIKCRTLTNLPSDIFWEQMHEYDVFVDSFYAVGGGIGGAMQGAMAFGLMGISDLRNICPETYRWMEPLPIISAHTASGLQAHLTALAKDPGAVEELRGACLGWAERHLAPEPMARYWKEHLCSL